MRRVLKKLLATVVAAVVSCHSMVYAFASSSVSSDIIGYYSGVENTQANMQISGISGLDDEIFVSAYFSVSADGFIVGSGRTSFVAFGTYCFTMPKVKMCQKNGTKPSGNFFNCVLYGDISRESHFFETNIYLSEGGYRYKQV